MNEFPFMTSYTLAPLLTKREIFAAMAMQGMLANGPGMDRLWEHSLEQAGPKFSDRIANVTAHTVERSRELADALLAELHRTDGDS